MSEADRAERAAVHLLQRAALRYSRASGPGGQHRDHAETRAELSLPRSALEGLPPEDVVRLCAAFGLDRRPLRLVSQAERSRERNRERVEERLRRRVAQVLAPRKARRPTAPSGAAKARRLADKARRSRVKAARRGTGVSEE